MYMSTEKLAAVLTAALLAVPAGLTAQGHRAHHPDAQAQSAGPGAMMGGGPGMLLSQRGALELTDDQVEKLEELRSRDHELRASHREAMAGIRRDALDVLTDEQQARLPSGTGGPTGMQPGAGMSGGAPGMGSGMMNMGGGAGGAHMMQMMAAMHARMHGQTPGQGCPMIPTPSNED